MIEEINTLTPPRSRNVVGTNVQAGAKIHEDRGGKTLGEDIGELRRGGNMKHTDSPKGDPFPNEVEVDLHVLGALMLNGVGGEVAGADIVAVDEACGVQGMVKFLEQLPQPSGFSDAVGNSPVLCLGAGPGDSGLPLGGPGDQAASEEDGVAGGGAAGVRAAGPISVGVDTELCWGCSGNDQTMAEGALKIAKDPLGSDKVSFPRIMHMKAHTCWTA